MSAEEPLQVPLKGAGGEDRGQLQIPQSLLDERVRYALLKEAVVMYQANKRAGTHQTKTRAYVAGSTRKPWKQKGTGRARAGTRKSPLWRGGGVIFGPHPRDYSYAIPRKQRQAALRSALFAKVRDGEVLVLEGLQAALLSHGTAPSTRVVAAALRAIGVRGRCLIGTHGTDKNLYLSARNIPGVLVSPVKEFNALDVLTAKTVILTREAFDSLLAEGTEVTRESPAV